MSNGPYYLRTGSKVLGPLSMAQLESLQMRGRLKADFVISRDRKQWQPASDFFASVTESPGSIPRARVIEGENWYYAEGDREVGPVNHADLVEKIRAGVLQRTGLVWKEGFTEWQTVQNVPELDLDDYRSPPRLQSASVPVNIQRLCLSCGAQNSGGGDFCPHCGNSYLQQANRGGNLQLVAVEDRKDRIVAALLALFLGGLGIHHFYLGQTLLGVIYLLFCWTFIPAFIALIEGIALLCTSGAAFDARYNLSQKA